MREERRYWVPSLVHQSLPKGKWDLPVPDTHSDVSFGEPPAGSGKEAEDPDITYDARNG
jgi:hypothetical protein